MPLNQQLQFCSPGITSYTHQRRQLPMKSSARCVVRTFSSSLSSSCKELLRFSRRCGLPVAVFLVVIGGARPRFITSMRALCCGAGFRALDGFLQQWCTLWPAQLATSMNSTRALAAKAKTKPKGKGRNDPKKGSKQAGKKVKVRVETVPFNEKDPHLQRIITMLTPPAAAASSPAAAESAELHRRAREFGWRSRQEHLLWLADLGVKGRLKQAALASLPPELRAMAEAEDLRPYPLTRNFFYATPPTAYTE